MKTKKSPVIVTTLFIFTLLLAACGTQAKAGSLYVAGDNAKVSTVINMTSLHNCGVDAGTVAYAYRETYFGIYEGSHEQTNVLLTQIYHDGSGCSGTYASYDFIRENPSDAGWTELKSGTAEWLTALKKLCGSDRTGKPEDLQKLCDAQAK